MKGANGEGGVRGDERGRREQTGKAGAAAENKEKEETRGARVLRHIKKSRIADLRGARKRQY